MMPHHEWSKDARTPMKHGRVLVTRRTQYTEADFEQFAEDWQIAD